MPKGEFQGFRKPTTTSVPDEVFDELMAELSGAEFKVLLYICRRTFGFKKDDDNISISQMLKGIVKKNGEHLDWGVGLSKPTLLRALKQLTEKRVIIAEQRSSRSRGFEATNYRLNFVDPLGKETNQGEYQKFTKPLVKKRDQQQTVDNKQSNNTVINGSQSAVMRLPRHDQPVEHTNLIADDIRAQFGDHHSLAFYRQVAARIPESIIRQALAELKADGGAKHPPAVFTDRMSKFALDQLKKGIG